MLQCSIKFFRPGYQILRDICTVYTVKIIRAEPKNNSTPTNQYPKMLTV